VQAQQQDVPAHPCPTARPAEKGTSSLPSWEGVGGRFGRWLRLCGVQGRQVVGAVGEVGRGRAGKVALGSVRWQVGQGGVAGLWAGSATMSTGWCPT